MSEKRYNTNADKKEIIQGLEFFTSSENPDLVNPREIKDLMDKLEFRDKMPFIYDLIEKMCSDREIRRKGGLTKDQFVNYIEEKLSDPESKDGINTLYNVFTDTKEEPLPMTNFCRTARQIGDNEKDQELKELLENADMTGKELTFDEFYEIMKNDEEQNNRQNLRNYKKNQPKVQNLYSIKYSKKKEEPPEEKEEPNRYSYKRVKVETKNAKPKEDEPKEEKVEKKIVLAEIITTEKEIELPANDARYKSLNKDKNEDEGNTKQYSFKVNKKVYTVEKEEKDNENGNNEDKGENNDKRYHRRYRASYKPNEQKTETTVTYNRYRRKF